MGGTVREHLEGAIQEEMPGPEDINTVNVGAERLGINMVQSADCPVNGSHWPILRGGRREDQN